VPGRGQRVRAVVQAVRTLLPGSGRRQEAVVDARTPLTVDRAALDARARALAMAGAVIALHIADRDGWCAGCLDQWGRLAPHPCSQATWASALRTAYFDTDGCPPVGVGRQLRHPQGADDKEPEREKQTDREDSDVKPMTYDAADEVFADNGPLVGENDVVGLYPPDIAAVVSRGTASDPGSGPMAPDD
jgi:hypothetical protein